MNRVLSHHKLYWYLSFYLIPGRVSRTHWYSEVLGQVRKMLIRDEIVWFIRHSSKENQNKKTAEEDFRDSKISELISSVIQLRTLVQKHSGKFLFFTCLYTLTLSFSFIIKILRWSHAKVQCTFTSCRN